MMSTFFTTILLFMYGIILDIFDKLRNGAESNFYTQTLHSTWINTCTSFLGQIEKDGEYCKFGMFCVGVIFAGILWLFVDPENFPRRWPPYDSDMGNLMLLRKLPQCEYCKHGNSRFGVIFSIFHNCVLIYVYRFLWPLRLGWLLVCCLYKEVYLKNFKRVSLWLHGCCGKWEGWARKTG